MKRSASASALVALSTERRSRHGLTWFSLMLTVLVVAGGCSNESSGRSETIDDAPTMLDGTQNLGFEDGGDGWYRTGEGDVRLDETTVRTGRRSAFVSQRDTADGSVLPAGWQQGYKSAAFAGKSVRVSGWIKTSGVPKCRKCNTKGMTQGAVAGAGEGGAWLNFFSHPAHAADGNGEPIQAKWSTPHVTGTTDWKRFEATLQLPTDAEEAYLQAVLWGPGEAWFDDLGVVAK